MSMYYDREGKAISLFEWTRLLDHSDRVLKRDELEQGVLSTVWIGINHAFDDGPPLIFETMFFANSDSDPNNEYCERYSSEQDAIAGHARILKVILDRGSLYEHV